MPRKVKGRYRQVIRAVYESPWAIRPEKLDAIRGFLHRRSLGEALTREEIQAVLAARGQPASIAPAKAESQKVALINVMGTISQRLSLMDQISGGVSTEQLGKAFEAALADGNVSTIVLNIDSPGGSVFGVRELAEQIHAARGAKRIVAIANSEAASAAYWIASAAGELWAMPGAWVGSIGVMMLHYSTAGWEQKEGYQTTITRKPDFKVEGAAGEALSDEAKAYRQKLVDTYYAAFLGAVATHRGVSTAAAEQRFGQGRMVLAEEALAVGMIDRIGTLAELLGELGVTNTPTASGTSGEPAFPLEGFSMNPKIFGALVRIGMCAITASIDEAQASLARFFAGRGVEKPEKEEDQLAALEGYIKTLPVDGQRAQTQQLAAAVAPLRAVATSANGDDRAADITAAVRLASNIPSARQVELIGELIGARDSAGQPITVTEAIRRLQTEASQQQQQTSTGATVLSPGAAERDKFHAAARDAILQRTLRGTLPREVLNYRTGQMEEWKPLQGGPRNVMAIAQQCLMICGAPASRVLNMAPMQIAQLIMGKPPEQLGLSGLFASSDGPGYNVSGMFSNILFDAANVSLRRSYNDARTTFQIWAARGEDIPDFKDAHRIIAGELGDPKAIPEDGEFEETTLTDGREKYRLTIWGQIFSYSWQLVVNDHRLGSFMEIPAKLGNSMRRKTNRLVYQDLKDNAVLADNVALFDDATHDNLTTGALTTSADYTAAWGTMAKKMREQKGLSDESGTLNIPPRFALFPPAIRDKILTALVSVSLASSGNAGEKNIWEGELVPVEESELGAASTGGSDTAHYLTADPAEVDTVEYAYLEGMPAPILEQEVSFSHLAIKQRIYFAFGRKPLDFRGMQKHTGAP